MAIEFTQHLNQLKLRPDIRATIAPAQVLLYAAQVSRKRLEAGRNFGAVSHSRFNGEPFVMTPMAVATVRAAHEMSSGQADPLELRRRSAHLLIGASLMVASDVGHQIGAGKALECLVLGIRGIGYPDMRDSVQPNAFQGAREILFLGANYLREGRSR